MPKSRRKKRSKSKSGYIGVVKKPSGKFEAVIRIDGNNKYLGSSYVTAKQAAKAYDKAAFKLRVPFSKLNYPKKVPVGYTPKQQPLLSRNTVGYRGVSKVDKKFAAKIAIGGSIHTLVYTKQPKKPPLPTIALFSKPTNPRL